MSQISRSTLLISIALMIAMVAAACDSAAEKPTAEPPTPVPTVASQAVSTDSALSVREALANPEVLQCLSEQLGDGFDADSGAIGPELLGRLGPQELAMLESCGVDVAGALGGAGSAASLDDPEVQECLAAQLDMDLSAGEFDLNALRQLDPTETSAAFVACGAEFGRLGGGGGIRGGGGFVGGGFADPEIRECLTGILGDDALDNLGQGSGVGLGAEWLAAFEECGINFGDTGGGRGFGGGGGLFGGGQRGEGSGGFANGSFQDCLTGELGDDALTLLRNPSGAPSPELEAALEKCGGGVSIQLDPESVFGDGGGSIAIEPAVEPVEPTATSIPVSDLTIEQLTCLSSELDPSDLAAAVVATSAGDLSDISDELLAALQTCGVGS